MNNNSQNQQIESMLTAIIALAGRDFSKKAIYTGNHEMLDALSEGINMLTEEVQESTVGREYIDSIFEAIPNVIIVCDAKGYVKNINKVISSYGYKKEEIINLHISDLSEPLHQLIKTSTGRPHESVFQTKEGLDIPISVSISFLDKDKDKDKDKDIIIVFYDLSSQKKAEAAQKESQQQLQQSQKMESIGRLAGGIAHDFNNLMGGIIGYIELFKKLPLMQQKNKQQAQKYLDIMEKSVLRASDLTKNLLGFARKGQYESSEIDIKEVILEVRDIIYRTISSKISIKVDIAPSLPSIKGDSNQLMQVLMNLALNAVDAMPKGGALLIECSLLTPDEAFCKTHSELRPNKPYLKITVSDTGIGINKKTMKNIFEPFFTTKEVGQGTGLGLAMVFGIVKAHHGEVYVYSEMEIGTTFSVYLPTVAKTMLKTSPKPKFKALKAFDITVLVIDDEPIMRELSEDILSGFGSRVITARDGKDGLIKFEEHQDEIALILLDVIMPIMDGYAVFHEIRKLKPTLPIIFCSGYSESTQITQLRKQKHVGYVQKPYRMAELNQLIENILNKN